LEHGQVFGLLCDLRNRLDRGRTGANDSDPLGGEVDTVMRPLAGVVALALECLQALERRHVGGGKRADGSNDKAGGDNVALFGADCPKFVDVVEDGLDDAFAKLNVGLEVEAFSAVIEIAQNLVLLGIALGPVPLLRQVLVERIAVDLTVGIATCAWIAIPVPGAADPVAGLEHCHVEVELVAQRMQHVHAGKPGTDDDSIEAGFHSCSWQITLRVRHNAPPVVSMRLSAQRRLPVPSFRLSRCAAAPASAGAA
jgi:hypothetical protein